MGKSQRKERIKNVKAAAGGDPDLLLAAASSASKDASKDATAGGDADLLAAAAKDFQKNRHFILKKMEKHPEIAEKLKLYVENGIGTY